MSMIRFLNAFRTSGFVAIAVALPPIHAEHIGSKIVVIQTGRPRMLKLSVALISI
jgi:hypothetical protein